MSQPRVLTIFLLILGATQVFSFNLRSTDDTSVAQSSLVEPEPALSATGLEVNPAQHIHDAATKYLSPAEQMIMKEFSRILVGNNLNCCV